jgi:hypothetical protein
MTQWEYKYEKLSWQYKKMIGELNELGNEGWELCAAFRVEDGSLSGILKRELE